MPNTRQDSSVKNSQPNKQSAKDNHSGGRKPTNRNRKDESSSRKVRQQLKSPVTPGKDVNTAAPKNTSHPKSTIPKGAAPTSGASHSRNIISGKHQYNDKEQSNGRDQREKKIGSAKPKSNQPPHQTAGGNFSGSTFYSSPNASSLPRPPFAKSSPPRIHSTSQSLPLQNIHSPVPMPDPYATHWPVAGYPTQMYPQQQFVPQFMHPSPMHYNMQFPVYPMARPVPMGPVIPIPPPVPQKR